jgi:hypothetical protein
MPFNPVATFPFSPDQTDFLCFTSPDGFAAVELNLIEGFVAFLSDEQPARHLTRVQLTNGSFYDSTESVPQLVNRYSEIKRRRYDPARAEREIIKPPQPTQVPSPVPQPASVTSGANSIWKKTPDAPGT